MQKRQIVNIVNFIRDVEPRGPVDLVEPVREQIALMKRHRLPGTFLLQYDALLDPVYTDMPSCGSKDLRLRYGGAEYGIALRQGTFDGPTRVRSENGKVEAAIVVRGEVN